ncbi:MAG: hypothetical protein NTZ25_00420 [Candidatus Peregrinibacteria bacterium]|nr:hypothetical protein [Candidatus Peregrinibacteria bacterium]
MTKFISKILTVATIAMVMPMTTTQAGGSMPATTLTGSVSSENAINLSWTTPDKNDYQYVYDFYDGYAVLMNGKTFAMLKFENNNYNYYNLSGMKKGSYKFEVDLYYYDVNGIHYVNPSNKVELKIADKIVEKKISPVKMKVDESGDKVVLNWSTFTGKFDGYIIKLAEIDKNYKEFPKNTIYYYLSTTDTSYSGLDIAAGHRYNVQVLPYLKNNKGTLDYVKGAASNRKLINLAEDKIVLSAQAIGGKIEANFTSTGKQIDGYAIYVVYGKQGEVSLDKASPVFLSKDKTTFTAYPSDTGSYTLKVYAYNELPNGTKVYHQPGSNWVTVENNIL